MKASNVIGGYELGYRLVYPLAISSDKISVTHEIKLCTPVPTDSWDKNVLPELKDCGVYEKYLEDFPANDLPSGGTSNRISPSEMFLLYTRFDNYPYVEDVVKHKWVRKRDEKTLYELSFNVFKPDPTWTWWYMWSYSFVGHFDHEISEPGDYYVEVITPWGNATVDFTVKSRCTDPACTLIVE